MKLVFTHPNFAQVGLVRTLLQSERIPCVTRNEHLSALAGGLPALDTWAQLWVADEDFLLAQSVVNQVEEASETSFEAWDCPRCGERNEGNMGVCWKCDFEIDSAESV